MPFPVVAVRCWFQYTLEYPDANFSSIQFSQSTSNIHSPLLWVRLNIMIFMKGVFFNSKSGSIVGSRTFMFNNAKNSSVSHERNCFFTQYDRCGGQVPEARKNERRVNTGGSILIMYW